MQMIRDESRWPPVLSIIVVFCLLTTIPGHVHALPVWVSYLAMVALVVPMAAVALTKGNIRWLGIERIIILFFAAVYVVNTIVELADMIGVITLHRTGNNAFALLSSAVAIWVVNVLAFSLLYWQIDRGGPYGRARKLSVRAGLGLSATGAPGLAARLAAIVPRLSLSWIQHRDGFQSHRCLAPHASRQDADGDRKYDLALDVGHRPVARHQCAAVAEYGMRLQMRRRGSSCARWSAPGWSCGGSARDRSEDAMKSKDDGHRIRRLQPDVLLFACKAR